MSQHGSVRRDRFEIVAPLGQGGFGSVFEAIDWLSGERVALKELNRVDARSLARFKKEYRALAGLHHPNLVGLSGLFEQDSRWYIVMEYVPGSDLLSYVRGPHGDEGPPPKGFDEGRLRTAVGGMHAGLVALHEAGILHRDLKPSNVNVTPTGRAVLLDFGLVTSTRQSRQSTLAGGVGTAAYMAPEQAMGEKVGAAADWYAFGACLFEALTGELPHAETNALRMLVAKQSRPARRVSELVDVPPELDALCAALLQRDPSQRPAGEQVAERLGLHPTGPGREATQPRIALSMTAGAPLVGRARELERLRATLERTRRGEFAIVMIEGDRGIGKTELAREFLRSSRRRAEGFLGLWGGCHEDDQLGYRGFDGCIDELARALGRADAECESLLPANVKALADQFPLLLGLPAVRNAIADQAPAEVAPGGEQAAAFSALAELLRGLSARAPLVLVLDDLHFGDAGTFALLSALREASPALPLLIVATVRSEVEYEPATTARLLELRGDARVQRIRLGGLSAEEAAELASTLIGPDARPADVQAVALESEGHPVFIGELAVFARLPPEKRKVVVTLESALLARIHSLGAAARALLEVVAVAGRPVPARVLAAVLGAEDLEAISRPLLSAHLIERRHGHELGFVHGLTRDLVLANISDARQRTLRESIAAFGI